MKLVIFGANGPTGLDLCRQALAAGHRVTAAVRRPGHFPLQDDALTVVEAHVMGGSSLTPTISDADAALSALGMAYSRSRDPPLLGRDKGNHRRHAGRAIIVAGWSL